MRALLLLLLLVLLLAAPAFAGDGDEGDTLGDGSALLRLKRIERDVARDGGFADDEVEDGAPGANGPAAAESDTAEPDAADAERVEGADRDAVGVDDGEPEERERTADELLRELDGMDEGGAPVRGAHGARGAVPRGVRGAGHEEVPRGAGRDAAHGVRVDGHGTGGQAPSSPPATADDDEVR